MFLLVEEDHDVQDCVEQCRKGTDSHDPVDRSFKMIDIGVQHDEEI